MWLTYLAMVCSIILGVIRLITGAKIIATRTYSYKKKTIFGPRKVIVRTGESTRAYGISTLVSGIVLICVLLGLIMNQIFEPTALAICPSIVAVFVEASGFLISERSASKKTVEVL